MVISVILHFKHFKEELTSIHVWRQTQTQSTITNFYEEGMNIFKPTKNDRGNGDGVFRMEFPLMQWLVACIYKIFGNHLIITRIFMFIAGLFSVFGIYRLLVEIFQNKDIAIIGAWAFNFSPCFYYYTINPLPDNFALSVSIWGVVVFFRWFRKNKSYLLLLSGLLIGIGALCKLPFILYFLIPLTHFIIEIKKSGARKEILIGAFQILIFTTLPLSWYLLAIPTWNGNGIIAGLLGSSDSFKTILDYLQHNLISTLPELLLNYGSVLFFVMGFYFIIKNKSFRNPLFPVFIVWSAGILLYFLFEVNMIAKVHDYYLFPFYPILFILVAYGAYNMLGLQNRLAKSLVFLLLAILPLTAYLRMKVRWDLNSPGFNKDLLVYKDDLRNSVPQKALCIAGNDESHFIFFYYIDKKGWGFDNDGLTTENIKGMIAKGAQYLYSDSRSIDENKNIKPYLDKLISEKGSIRIYKLKNIESLK